MNLINKQSITASLSILLFSLCLLSISSAQEENIRELRELSRPELVKDDQEANSQLLIFNVLQSFYNNDIEKTIEYLFYLFISDDLENHPREELIPLFGSDQAGAITDLILERMIIYMQRYKFLQAIKIVSALTSYNIDNQLSRPIINYINEKYNQLKDRIGNGFILLKEKSFRSAITEFYLLGESSLEAQHTFLYSLCYEMYEQATILYLHSKKTDSELINHYLSQIYEQSLIHLHKYLENHPEDFFVYEIVLIIEDIYVQHLHENGPISLENLYASIEKYIENKDYERAVQLCEELTRYYEGDAIVMARRDQYIEQIHNYRIEGFLNQAENAYLANNIDLAIEYTQEALAISSESTRAQEALVYYESLKNQEIINEYFQVALTRAEQGDLDSAIYFLTSILEMEPNNGRALMMFERLFEQQLLNNFGEREAQIFSQAEQAYLSDNYQTSLMLFNQLNHIIGENDFIHSRIETIQKEMQRAALRHEYQQNYNEYRQLLAEKDFRLAFQLLSQMVQSYGESYPGLQTEYDRLRQMVQDYYNSLNLLESAKIHHRNNEFQQAYDYYLDVYTKTQEYPELTDLHEEAYLALQELAPQIIDSERNEYLQQLEIFHENLKAGITYYDLGNYRKSIYHLEISYEIDKNNPILLDYLQKATRARRIEEMTIISETHPAYDILIVLLEEAKRLYEQGMNQIELGNQQQGIMLLNRSLDKWEILRGIVPFNLEVNHYSAKILLAIDPQRYSQYIEELMQEGESYLAQNNLGEASSIFNIVERIRGNYTGDQLTAQRQQIENQQQLNRVFNANQDTPRVPVETENNLENWQQLYQQALNEYAEQDYQNAMNTLSRLMQSSEVPRDLYTRSEMLYSQSYSRYNYQNQIQNNPSLQSPTRRIEQDSRRNELYQQAYNAYIEQNYNQTLIYCDRALEIDPDFSRAVTLKNSALQKIRAIE